MSGTNSHGSGTDKGTGYKTATTPMDVNVNTFVGTATSTSTMDSASSSGLGVTDCDKIGRVETDPFYLKTKTNCKETQYSDDNVFH